MDKLLENVRNAADNLRKVALHLRTPLDTSSFDKAVDDLAEALKPKRPVVVDKPADK